MNRPVLDLTNYAFKRDLGDITLYGTWYGADHDEAEPALVLVPTFRQVMQDGQQRAKPCCIALSSAYRYDDPRYLAARAMEFSAAMGFEDSMSRTHKIADIIHGHLQDLIELPPKPVRGQYVGADAVMTGPNGQRRTAEIIETY